MSKKKGKIRIRRAKQADKNLVMKLWAEYLDDKGSDSAGGTVPSSEHNMEVFGNIFDAYVTGEHDGVVLLHAEDAVLMWGDPGGQLFETSLGRSAQGWGIYLRETHRGKGLSAAMRTKAANILKEMGFDSVCGHVDPDNEDALQSAKKFGFKTGGVIVYYDLKEH